MRVLVGGRLKGGGGRGEPGDQTRKRIVVLRTRRQINVPLFSAISTRCAAEMRRDALRCRFLFELCKRCFVFFCWLGELVVLDSRGGAFCFVCGETTHAHIVGRWGFEDPKQGRRQATNTHQTAAQAKTTNYEICANTNANCEMPVTRLCAQCTSTKVRSVAVVNRMERCANAARYA